MTWAELGPKRINLVLQGGGAHGAYTWGVLGPQSTIDLPSTFM
jgi:predicted patatin/cPLA2 family phospholipase